MMIGLLVFQIIYGAGILYVEANCIDVEEASDFIFDILRQKGVRLVKLVTNCKHFVFLGSEIKTDNSAAVFSHLKALDLEGLRSLHNRIQQSALACAHITDANNEVAICTWFDPLFINVLINVKKALQIEGKVLDVATLHFVFLSYLSMFRYVVKHGEPVRYLRYIQRLPRSLNALPTFININLVCLFELLVLLPKIMLALDFFDLLFLLDELILEVLVINNFFFILYGLFY